jgi:hypothetical protein
LVEIWCAIIRLGAIGDKVSLLTVNASLTIEERVGHPSMLNFDVSQLPSLAGKAAASGLPLVKPWADRIGDSSEQAADLALKTKEACQ